MFVSVVQFDEILHVQRNETNRTTPKHTVFSFMSNFEYTPYVSVPGFPRLAAGMRVAALLREKDNWKTLVGWRDLDTGSMAKPDIKFHTYRLFFSVVWLLLAGYGVVTQSSALGNLAPLLAAVLLSLFLAFFLLDLRSWRQANEDVTALHALLPNAA